MRASVLLSFVPASVLSGALFSFRPCVVGGFVFGGALLCRVLFLRFRRLVCALWFLVVLAVVCLAARFRPVFALLFVVRGLRRLLFALLLLLVGVVLWLLCLVLVLGALRFLVALRLVRWLLAGFVGCSVLLSPGFLLALLVLFLRALASLFLRLLVRLRLRRLRLGARGLGFLLFLACLLPLVRVRCCSCCRLAFVRPLLRVPVLFRCACLRSRGLFVRRFCGLWCLSCAVPLAGLLWLRLPVVRLLSPSSWLRCVRLASLRLRGLPASLRLRLLSRRPFPSCLLALFLFRLPFRRCLASRLRRLSCLRFRRWRVACLGCLVGVLAAARSVRVLSGLLLLRCAGTFSPLCGPCECGGLSPFFALRENRKAERSRKKQKNSL